MHDNDLDRLLEGSKPPVATRSRELQDALAQLQRSVEARAVRAPRTRKARVVVGGLSLAAVVCGGAAAAAVVPSFWPDGADVKRYRTADKTCEAVFTVSNGPAPQGTRAEVAARQAEARSVAEAVLRDFEYVPEKIAEELEDADYLPVEKAGTPESSAFVHAAARAVDAELARRGLPEVTIGMESGCEASNR